MAIGLVQACSEARPPQGDFPDAGFIVGEGGSGSAGTGSRGDVDAGGGSGAAGPRPGRPVTGGPGGEGSADSGVGGASAAGSGGVAGDASGAGGGAGAGAGEGGSDSVDDCGDCDDHIDCTTDSCSEGACAHELNTGACEPDQICDLLGGGCVAASACGDDDDCMDDDPCTRNERCDDGLAVCQSEPLDNDGDGHSPVSCGGDDPKDNDESVHPGAAEICDGKDNNANGDVDEDPAASDSCEFGTCRDGECPGGCTADDDKNVFDFLSPGRLTHAVEFQPCATGVPEEFDACVRSYAEQEGISSACVTCMVPLAQCIAECGPAQTEIAESCTTCACVWTDCASACIDAFNECSATPFSSGC